MTIIDFTTLSITEQLELLYSEGVYLSKRKASGVPIILYQFDKLYVEIYYEKYRAVVDHILCTTSTSVLNPYLNDIKIEGIFN